MFCWLFCFVIFFSQQSFFDVKRSAIFASGFHRSFSRFLFSNFVVIMNVLYTIFAFFCYLFFFFPFIYCNETMVWSQIKVIFVSMVTTSFSWYVAEQFFILFPLHPILIFSIFLLLLFVIKIKVLFGRPL